MEEKIKNPLTDNIAETLYITLAMKCLEQKHKHSMLYDPYSVKVRDKIEYDFDKFNNATTSAAGVILRTRAFDKVAQNFIDTHNQCLVINIGCGLDTRYNRLKDRKQAWFIELDLPEVMELRKKVLPAETNQIYLADSMFNKTWKYKIREQFPGWPTLILIEGVLMYFTEAEVKALLKDLAGIFHGAQLYFHAISTFMVNRTRQHDTVKKTKAVFKWGTDHPAEIANWAPNLVYDGLDYFIDFPERRWVALKILKMIYPPLARSTFNLKFHIG